jgi:hypothetical protein
MLNSGLDAASATFEVGYETPTHFSREYSLFFGRRWTTGRSQSTGHGAVVGACITAIKFFYDCTQKIRPLLNAIGRDVVVPSDDGLTLNTYTGSDADSLDINGELSKLAFNISLGHEIHAGIHFRSSSFWSILLGEQVALSVLNDRAKSYAEPFTITITKFDGTLAKISNERSW